MTSHFQVDESVVLSSEKEIALSMGVVYSITKDFLCIVLDRYKASNAIFFSIHVHHVCLYVSRLLALTLLCICCGSFVSFLLNPSQVFEPSCEETRYRFRFVQTCLTLWRKSCDRIEMC